MTSHCNWCNIIITDMLREVKKYFIGSYSQDWLLQSTGRWCMIFHIHFYFQVLVKYCHVVFIVVLFWLGSDRSSRVAFCICAITLLLSILTPIFLHFSSVDMSHSCCSSARVFGRALVHEFLTSYSLAEWCLHFFPTVQLYVLVRRSRRDSLLGWRPGIFFLFCVFFCFWSFYVFLLNCIIIWPSLPPEGWWRDYGVGFWCRLT